MKFTEEAQAYKYMVEQKPKRAWNFLWMNNFVRFKCQNQYSGRKIILIAFVLICICGKSHQSAVTTNNANKILETSISQVERTDFGKKASK
jgi:hypothetical protein